MRKRSPLTRAGRAAQRAAERRRLEACPPAVVVPAGSPDRLCRTLSERVPRMARHHRAVAELAGALARQIGLREEDLHAVVRAAELHDVGKVFVPDTILDKPGKLSTDELELMRRHAIAGWLILHESAEPEAIARLVRSSHERWDGTGYPDGLRGEEIPLGARVVSVCDAFDAMTSSRPYRPPIPVEDALAELQACAGTQFDPRVVDVLAEVALSVGVPAS